MSSLSPEAQAQLSKLATDLAHNPKTRKRFVNLVKEIDPSKTFPDVELEDLRESIEAKFADRDHQEAARKATRKLERQRASLIESGRFKEEDVEKIEKEVMEAHGISDYEVAATYYGAITKPVTPTSEIKSQTWKMPPMTKDDISNIGHHTLQNAYAVIDEIKGKRVH